MRIRVKKSLMFSCLICTDLMFSWCRLEFSPVAITFPPGIKADPGSHTELDTVQTSRSSLLVLPGSRIHRYGRDGQGLGE